MRALIALALALVPAAAFAHPGHGEPGPLHGLDHALGSPENLVALGFVLALVAAGGLLLWRVRKNRTRP